MTFPAGLRGAKEQFVIENLWICLVSLPLVPRLLTSREKDGHGSGALSR
jgi:hypothetical protein